MCGIVGFVGDGFKSAVEKMNSVQFHRGPDDSGVFIDSSRQFSMAMRRLSIIDLSGGHQPMTDPSGRFTIVYNGEVFNAPALRKGLEVDGYKFSSNHSDTEVILNLYIRDKKACVKQLNGMFAFAIYDAQRGTMFLARDPFGIKPLFYFKQGNRFGFASELKSIKVIPEITCKLDLQSLHHYLTLQFIPPPRTIYSGINKLPAGHFLTYSFADNDFEVEQYWTPGFAGIKSAAPREEIVSELRTHLERAANNWMMSDVDVGFSLSGGIDSAALVGLQATTGDKQLKTWTLGFEEAASGKNLHDERGLAALVAQRWNTEHHEIVIKASDILGDLEDMVGSLDEPYAGGLPSWYVFKAMSKDVKVGVVGSGGDELFGNYGKWRVLQKPSIPWLRHIRRRLMSNGITQCLKYPQGALYPGYIGEIEKHALYKSKSSKFNSTAGIYQSLWDDAGADPKQAVAYIDVQMQLPEEFLMMTDRFSMAWSLEARPPLLDKQLAEFVMSISPNVRSPRDRLKGLLIDSVRDLLPDEIVTARKKGFVLPLEDWLRNELRPMVEHLLGVEYLQRQGIFRADLFEFLARPFMEKKTNATSKLWTILMFQLWWDQEVGL